MNIRKGDKVLIIKGKDRGKSGAVLKMFAETGKVVVDGLNLIKKRSRARKMGEKGQMITVPAPLYANNIKLICSQCGKAVRVGHKIENEKKIRICTKCKQTT